MRMKKLFLKNALLAFSPVLFSVSKEALVSKHQCLFFWAFYMPTAFRRLLE